MTRTTTSTGRRVGFKRHLRLEFADGGITYLIEEGAVTALEGSCAAPLARLLDGTRDLAGVLRDAPATLSSQEVAAGVRRLAEAGLLTVHADHDDAEPVVLAYWDAAGMHGSQVLEELRGKRVELLSLSQIDTAPVADAFQAAAIPLSSPQDSRSAPADERADLTVVLCDDYLDPRLAAINDDHRRTGRPWLIAKPTGTEVWVGPFFVPGDGPCWRCLADRIAVHRSAEAHLRELAGDRAVPPPPRVSLPVTIASAACTIALEAVKWLGGHRHPGQRRVWTQDTLTLRVRHHEAVRRPQCPSCGDPDLMRRRAHRPVEPVSRRKAPGARGGHRSAAPESVLERYRHLVGPITGIVAEITPDERGPRFFNSYRSGPNLALRARTLKGLRSMLRSHSGGKGVTAVEAKAGALCEAAERFCGSFQGDECRISGSFEALRHLAIHPNACQLFDERQYAARAEWNSAHGPLLHIPEPFDERAVIDWTPVWSLSRREHRLLPTSMLYYGAPGPVPADSNGNAAGSSLEDAILQGLLELIERDAVAIWWYNRLRMPEFDLDDLGDPWIDRLRQVHADLGRQVWVLDVTSDLGVPAMAALSRRTSGGPERIMFGFGAHLDPAVAVRRALTELNQAMPWVVAEQRECGDPDLERWLREITVEQQPYLTPDPHAPKRRRKDHPYVFEPDLAEDIASIQATLEAAGLEVLVLDQTRPDVGLPVVKVIVPGLRPFWARFAPGRLFDVPVRMGLRERPTRYADLNPIPLFA